MSNEQVDAFLKGESEPAPAEAPPPEPVVEAAPQPTPEPAPKPENDDDESIPAAQEGDPVVPRRALEDERHKRQSWVEKASRAEAERDMLAKQLEEFKKAAAAPPPVAPLAPIDLATDPEGYHRRNLEAHLNAQLNNSEMLVRDKLGDAVVDAAAAEFQEAAKADLSLYGKLYQQKHPYAWMIKEVERQRLQREVGDDPVKWRDAERERIRKEMEAERAEAAKPPVSPVAGLPPSLANVRSASPRNAPAFSGDQSLDDILSLRRKK